MTYNSTYYRFLTHYRGKVIVMHPALHPSFVQFIKEFNESHDYFECHEVLEDYWKEVAPRQKKHALTALILLSTAMYHWRRGNLPGASKTMNTSLQRLHETSNFSIFEMINVEKLKQDMIISFQNIQDSQKFSPFQIQVMDSNLLSLVDSLEIEISEDVQFLMHKHMLRDRSEILEEREKQKKRRNDQL